MSEKDISSKIEYDSEQSEDEVAEVEALKYGKKIQNFKNIKLISETKELANNIRKNFVSNISIHSWIQEFMKNSNYDIVDNEGNGDCFLCNKRCIKICRNRHISIENERYVVK